MRGRAAGMLLIVGIPLLAIMVGASSVSLRALHAIHADADGRHVVGGTYVVGWDSPLFNPFVDDRLTIFMVLMSVAYLLAVTSLGALIIRAIPGADRWPRPVRMLAGFIPGFLMVLAPLQIIFAALPLRSAAWVAWAVVVGLAVVAHRRRLASLGDAIATRRWPSGMGLGVVVATGGIVVLSAIHRLQAGRNFMVPDSVTTFLQVAQSHIAGRVPGGYLTQWDQQSDEWVFNAPLMFTGPAARDFLFPLFLTSALALASFACLVYGLIRSLASRRGNLAALVGVAFVLLSTPLVDPRYYVSLFGGQNPTAWLGHPGRYIGIVAPWLALVLMRRMSRLSATATLFAIAGLGFLSVHVTVYVVVAVAAVLLWRLLDGRRPDLLSSPPAQWSVHVLAGVVLFAPLVVFGSVNRIDQPGLLSTVLIASAVGAIAAAMLLAAGSRPAGGAGWGVKRVPSPRVLIAAFGVLILGFLVSGNLTATLGGGTVRRVLAAVLPGYDAPAISRGILGDSPVSNLNFPSFSGSECVISGHCLGAGGYLAAYGMFSVIVAAGWVALGRVGTCEGVARQRAVWLYSLAAVSLSFVLVDFTGSGLGVAWVLTRFIEVPYYGVLAASLAAVIASRSVFTAAVGVTVGVVWSLVPFFANLVPLQWLDIVHYIVSWAIG